MSDVSLRRATSSSSALASANFEIATEAYAQYGKGRHPAALNMGDCVVYACARVNGAKLLFKGEDFTKTVPSAG
jgi:ribonuclease VapC